MFNGILSCIIIISRLEIDFNNLNMYNSTFQIEENFE